MNSRDKENLKFLMNSPQKDFEAWMDEASSDDINYALEIIRLAKVELMVEQMELQELTITDQEDIIEVKYLLDRIRTGGIDNL